MKHLLTREMLCHFATSFVVLIVTYSTLLTRFVPTLDSENSQAILLDTMPGQGRFVAWLLTLALAPIDDIHPLDMLVALCAFAAAIAVVIRILCEELGPRTYAAAVVGAAFPTSVHMLGAFPTVNAVFGIGILSAALAVYTWTSSRRFVAAGLVLLTLATYQGLLVNVAVIYIGYAIMRLKKGHTAREVVVEGLTFLSALFAVLVAYSLMFEAFLLLSSTPRLTVDTVKISQLVSSLIPAARFLIAIGSGTDPIFLDRYIAVGVVHGVLIIAAAIQLIRAPRGGAAKALALTLAAAAISIPFLSIALTSGVVKYRSLMGAPFAALLLFLLAADPRFLPWIRHAVAAVGLLVSFLYAQSTVTMARYAAESWEQDRAFIEAVIERLKLPIPRRGSSKVYPIEMVNVIPRQSPMSKLGPRTTLGWSFFRYGEAMPWRIVGAFNLAGYPYFRPTSPAERTAAAPLIDPLPSWPADGSVALVADIVVLKFEPKYTPAQVDRYCRTNDECRAAVGAVGARPIP